MGDGYRRESLQRRSHVSRAAAGFSLAAGCAIGASCGPNGYTIRDDGMKVPNRWSGAIAHPLDPSKPNPIDFRRLYVHEIADGRDAGRIMVQRFWPNGCMVQWSDTRERLTRVGGDSFGDNPSPARYMIDRGEIIYEDVGVDETGAHFIRAGGRINANGDLQYFWSGRNGHRRPFLLEFRPVDVGEMTRVADW